MRRLRRHDARLRLERGEGLAGSRHLFREARNHAARCVVLVQRMTQLLKTHLKFSLHSYLFSVWFRLAEYTSRKDILPSNSMI